jgi:hypothetical protein
MSIAYSAGWVMKQIDIQNAFLHGFLYEEVYMHQPLGFAHPSLSHHICKLHKALYGLKQAPKAWFSQFSTKLIDLGFIGSKADTSLFTFKCPLATVFTLIYVNDINIIASVPSAIDELLHQLKL